MNAWGFGDDGVFICECPPQWLESPKLMSADAGAEYFETIEINMDEITEPIVCCPNDPDDARLLSEVRDRRVISAQSARHQRSIGTGSGSIPPGVR